MSDSDEYEKIDESCILKECDKNDGEMNVDNIQSSESPVITPMEDSVGDQIEESPIIFIDESVTAEEESESESSDSYIYYTDEELYESEVLDTELSEEIHEKSVNITNQKMKELKITTPDIIFVGGESAMETTEASESDTKLEDLKNIRQNLVETFAETKSFGVLTNLVKINDEIIQLQGFDDTKAPKDEQLPCSSTPAIQTNEDAMKLFGEVLPIIDDMNDFYEFGKKEKDLSSFREIHETFLENFLNKTGIKNPLIEGDKMEHYCNILYPLMNQKARTTKTLSACLFGKYFEDEFDDSFKRDLPPSESMSQDEIHSLFRLEKWIHASEGEAKIQEALTSCEAAEEEYASLLNEKDKAFAEDPKDTQLHEHMTKLCIEARIKCREAKEEYSKLCHQSSSKLTVVKGPTCNIPPKIKNMSFQDLGNEAIKEAEKEEANKNLPEAITLYSEAVDYFLKSIEHELEDDVAKENLRQKIQIYIVKYEKLRDYLLNFTNYEAEVKSNQSVFYPLIEKDEEEKKADDFNVSEYLQSKTESTNFKYFDNPLHQYQLYILLLYKITKPTAIQSEFLAALKNGVYAAEEVVTINIQALEDSKVRAAYDWIKETQEQCSDFLEIKGRAVLTNPENKSLQDDLVKSCCEAFWRWKAATKRYENEENSYLRQSSGRSPLEDISKNFKCEKSRKKISAKNETTLMELKKLIKKAAKLNKKLKKSSTFDDRNVDGDFDQTTVSESESQEPEPESYSNPSSNDVTPESDPIDSNEKELLKDGFPEDADKCKNSCKKLSAKRETRTLTETKIQELKKMRNARKLEKKFKKRLTFDDEAFDKLTISESVPPKPETPGYSTPNSSTVIVGSEEMDLNEKEFLINKLPEYAAFLNLDEKVATAFRAMKMQEDEIKLAQKANIGDDLNEDEINEAVQKFLEAAKEFKIRFQESKGLNRGSLIKEEMEKEKAKLEELFDKIKIDKCLFPKNDSSTTKIDVPKSCSASPQKCSSDVTMQDPTSSTKPKRKSQEDDPAIVTLSTIQIRDHCNLQNAYNAIKTCQEKVDNLYTKAEDINDPTKWQNRRKFNEELEKSKTEYMRLYKDYCSNYEITTKKPNGVFDKMLLQINELYDMASDFQRNSLNDGEDVLKVSALTNTAEQNLRKCKLSLNDGNTRRTLQIVFQKNLEKAGQKLKEAKMEFERVQDERNEAAEVDVELMEEVSSTNHAPESTIDTSESSDNETEMEQMLEAVGLTETGATSKSIITNATGFELNKNEKLKFQEGKTILEKKLSTAVIDDDWSSTRSTNSSYFDNISSFSKVVTISQETEEILAASDVNIEEEKSVAETNMERRCKNIFKSIDSERNLLQHKMQNRCDQMLEDPNLESTTSTNNGASNLTPQDELEEIKTTLKYTENSRQTLIEMNDILKAQKKDIEKKYKSVKEINEYLEKECKKLNKSLNELQQKSAEESEAVLKEKDAKIAQLQSELEEIKEKLPKASKKMLALELNIHQLHQSRGKISTKVAKRRFSKIPKKLVQSFEGVKIGGTKSKTESEQNLSEELAKAQEQIKYYQKLAADQAEALKNLNLAQSLEKQLSEANEKVDKVEKALRKREAMDSVSRDLVLKRFKEDDDDHSPVL